MTFSLPLLKLIGEKDMVIPITHRGRLLSNKSVMNFYYPEIIRLIDADGLMYEYQTVELSGGIQWAKSLKYLSILHYIHPLLSSEPRAISLQAFQELTSGFIEKTHFSRQVPPGEKKLLIDQIMGAATHRKVISLIGSVSYWR